MNGNALLGILLLAMVVEALIEYFVAPLFAEFDISDYAKYAAAVVAVAFCFAYDVDVLSELIGLESIYSWAGNIVSGLILGRGSNFLNDIIDLVRQWTGPQNPPVATTRMG